MYDNKYCISNQERPFFKNFCKAFAELGLAFQDFFDIFLLTQKHYIMETQKQWTLEEKLEYAESIKRWKNELIKVPEKNIYYHPEKHWRPYYVIKEGKWFKHKPYVVKNQTIRYTKNGITEIIHVSSFKPQNQENIENPFFN